MSSHRRLLPIQFAATIALLSSGLSAVQLAPAAPPLKLTLFAPRAEIESGQQVMLDAVLKNVSEKPIFFLLWPFPGEAVSAYRIQVTDQDSAPAPQTGFAQWIQHHVFAGSHPGGRVASGDAFSEEISLTRFFDITAPGTYRVAVARVEPPSSSSQLTITVRPGGGPANEMPPRIQDMLNAPPFAHPFAVTVSTPRDHIVGGEEVWLRVTITNRTDRPMPIDSWGWRSGPDGPERFYDLDVVDAKGGKPRATAFAQWAKRTVFGGEELPAGTLAAGGAITDDILLTKFIDFTVPGQYTVTVAPKYLTYPVPTSNKVTITVVP